MHFGYKNNAELESIKKVEKTHAKDVIKEKSARKWSFLLLLLYAKFFGL
jgi:hypothetical protein